jgi:hypothetical protein
MSLDCRGIMDADGTPTHASLGYHTLMFCQQTVERQNIHKEGYWVAGRQTDDSLGIG